LFDLSLFLFSESFGGKLRYCIASLETLTSIEDLVVVSVLVFVILAIG
jgi:hypothetical protein